MLSFSTVTETIKGSLIVSDFHHLTTHIFIELHFSLYIAIQMESVIFRMPCLILQNVSDQKDHKGIT